VARGSWAVRRPSGPRQGEGPDRAATAGSVAGLVGAGQAGIRRTVRNDLRRPSIRASPVLAFLGYFCGPIPSMIEAAVLLSAVARHWPDFAIILVLLLTNAIVGFWEERQAGNAIDALKAQLALTLESAATGPGPRHRHVSGPGDIIRVRLGGIVLADARLLAGDPVEVDQSALTGESLPATRAAGEPVLSGSIIRQGEAGALVYAAGADTYFGKTASWSRAPRQSAQSRHRGIHRQLLKRLRGLGIHTAVETTGYAAPSGDGSAGVPRRCQCR
jgi:magnesium-transporting ATPase (P-type)